MKRSIRKDSYYGGDVHVIFDDSTPRGRSRENVVMLEWVAYEGGMTSMVLELAEVEKLRRACVDVLKAARALGITP